MADTTYSNLSPDLKNAVDNNLTPWGPWTAGNYNTFNTEAGSDIANFTSQFTNMVGRAPTQEEIGQFQQQYLVPNVKRFTDPTSAQAQNPGSYIQQFVGQNFNKAAQDYATQQLQQQQAGWQGLADTARTQGNTAINATEQSLLDYQSSLFDRLRPNLITSLKSQGLLDTGGMNEAIAGVQGDLANNASNYMAQLRLQNEQNANNISLTGQAAPLQYQQNVTTGQPGFLNATGNAATGFNNDTFMNNLNYQHQLGLIQAQTNAQRDLQPSFMRTFSQSAANGLGTNLTAWTNPQAFSSASGGSGGAAGLMALI